MQRRRRQRSGYWFVIAAVALAIIVGGVSVPTGHEPEAVAGVADRRFPPLGHEGRWFTDTTGRVVMLRGMNFVAEVGAVHPRRRRLRRRRRRAASRERVQHGAARRRVRVPDAAARPDRPGVPRVDRETVRILGRHGIYVLLDFHQDGYGPGHPRQRDAAVGDAHRRAAQPARGRSRSYYVTNPALQRAFDNFWANRPGPDGVPLQTHYAHGDAHGREAVRVEPQRDRLRGDERAVAGRQLAAVHHRLPRSRSAAARTVLRADDRGGALGRSAPTRCSSSRSCCSTSGARRHVAAGRRLTERARRPTSTRWIAAANASVMDRSVAAAERDDAPADRHRVGRTRTTRRSSPSTEDQFDARLLPWLYWSYNGHVVTRQQAAARPAEPQRSGARRADPPVPDGRQRHADAPRVRHRDRDPRLLLLDASARRPAGAAPARDRDRGPGAQLPDRIHGRCSRGGRDVTAVRADTHIAQPAGSADGLGSRRSGGLPGRQCSRSSLNCTEIGSVDEAQFGTLIDSTVPAAEPRGCSRSRSSSSAGSSPG